MKNLFFIAILLFSCMSCKTERNGFQDTATEIAFDGARWQIRENDHYPFRDQMLNDLFEKDTLKGMKSGMLTEILGQPDRADANFLFYRISQERAAGFPLHTKTLVIEMAEDTVKAVRLHE